MTKTSLVTGLSAVLPVVAVLSVSMLLITYVPWLAMLLPWWFAK